MAPMWLRGRAVGLLLARRGSEAGLREVARLGAAAMELAGGYTDVFDDARRRKRMTPAAEIQQSLLPPRIVRMGVGELAGSVMPSYEVGGDWFDYVENRDGAWIAIADGAGRGPRAAGLSSVTLAALRAARRSGVDARGGRGADGRDRPCRRAARSSSSRPSSRAGTPSTRSSAGSTSAIRRRCSSAPTGRRRSWRRSPTCRSGCTDRARSFRRHQRRLADGDRLVLYTDGISRRRTADGPFDVDGIAAAVRAAGSRSAAAAARAIQEAVVSASEDPLPDDAAVVVLAATVGST